MPRRGGRPSRQYLEDTKRMQEKRKLREVGMLTGGQAKIAAKAPPTNKIDEKDFAVLRAEKAKGRGQGLQDEKAKPGKVMKARVGKSVKGTTAKSAMGKTFSGYQKVFKTGVSAGDKAKATSTIVGVKPTLPEAAKSSKVARRALKAAQATRLGKIVLPIAAAGVAAQQYLKSKMKKKEDKNKKTLKDFREQKKPGVPSEKTKTINSALNKLNKKMGGGMMKRPIGYKAGMGSLPKIETKSSPKGRGKKYRDMFKSKDGFNVKSPIQDTGITIFTKNKKMGGGMMKRPMMVKKGGGADTGRKGEFMSKLGVAINKIKRDRPTRPDLKKLIGKMGGGMMMQKPMGYKAGKSVKAKCKLGRNKPTKMY
tara:strand:+ start:5120 stop:6217 length:1098 start_codon:yes stop_codon:yes gene_type:complete